MAFAASVAIGGGLVGVALAGAGADAVNAANSNTVAAIRGAHPTAGAWDTDGDPITVAADSKSRINAAVLTTALALGAGKVGVGVGVGVSVAKNYIGYDATGAVQAGRGQTVAEVVNARLGGINGEETGALLVSAQSAREINATVFAGAGALGVGVVGVAVAFGGVFATNLIAGETVARIAGGNTVIYAGTVTVDADDVSRIDSTANAVALSMSAGLVGVSVSVAASTAQNQILSQTTAEISRSLYGASPSSTGRGQVYGVTGAVDVLATDNASIRARGAAVALSVAGGLVGAAVSGAGATIENLIGTRTVARVSSMQVEAANLINITALGTTAIDAKVISAAASLGAGLALSLIHI